jgi:hypothetical protein
VLGPRIGVGMPEWSSGRRNRIAVRVSYKRIQSLAEIGAITADISRQPTASAEYGASCKKQHDSDTKRRLGVPDTDADQPGSRTQIIRFWRPVPAAEMELPPASRTAATSGRLLPYIRLGRPRSSVGKLVNREQTSLGGFWNGTSRSGVFADMNYGSRMGTRQLTLACAVARALRGAGLSGERAGVPGAAVPC